MTRESPQQSSLWTDEQPLAQPSWSIQDIVVRPIYWADGDTSPEQLERLAMTMLGEWETLMDTTGQKHMFQIITSGIVDGEVLRAYEYYCPLKYFYHLQFGLPIPAQDEPASEDEDEEL